MILVTGASGFIGSALLDSLILKFGSQNIVALTSKPTEKCKYLLHNNYNFGKDYFVENGFGSILTVIHVGSFTPKSSFQANDCENSTSNVSNTNALLQSVLPNLRQVIFLSTLDIYADTDLILSEDSAVDPKSLYGFSKLFCEKLVEQWCSQNKIVSQILRIGHVFGPGEEKYQKVIPEMIRKILNKNEIEIFGTGDDIRTFIYIDDVVKSIIAAIDLEVYVGPINVVGNTQIAIKQLAEQLVSISKTETPINCINQDNLQRRDLIFDNSKMKKFLVSQQIDFTEGLKNEFNHMKNLQT